MINFFKKNKYRKLSKKIKKIKTQIDNFKKHETDEDSLIDLQIIGEAIDVAYTYLDELC